MNGRLPPLPSQPSLAAIPPTRTLFSSPLPHSSSSHSSLFPSIYPQGEVPLPPFFCVFLSPLRRLSLLSFLILQSSSFASLSEPSSPPPFFPFCNSFLSSSLILPFSSSPLSLSSTQFFLSFTLLCCVSFLLLSHLSFLPFFSPPFILLTSSPGFFFCCVPHTFLCTD